MLCVSLLEPQKNNWSNPEAYSEPCQTSKMQCFVKIVINLERVPGNYIINKELKK